MILIIVKEGYPDSLCICAVEDDHTEYKKSTVSKDGILKTVCAYANNYMNREIGLLFIGIEEENDKETGRKAVPVRPISGIEEAVKRYLRDHHKVEAMDLFYIGLE